MSALPCRFVLAALCATGLTGCGGEKLVHLEGRLVDNGQPLQWQETSVDVDLNWKNPDVQKPGKAYTARVGSDGTFAVEGEKGSGIPPGEYTLTIRSPGGAPGTRPPPLLEGLGN